MSLARIKGPEDFPFSPDQFSLIGLREQCEGIPWVPCVSCLHPAFERNYVIKHRVVYYQNARTSPLSDSPKPLMGNALASLEDVLAFLGSGETVPHVVRARSYWSTLLGRRVVAVPFSSKFYRFPFPVTYATRETLDVAIQKAQESKAPTDALAQCRETNVEFYEQICTLLHD